MMKPHSFALPRRSFLRLGATAAWGLVVSGAASARGGGLAAPPALLGYRPAATSAWLPCPEGGAAFDADALLLTVEPRFERASLPSGLRGARLEVGFQPFHGQRFEAARWRPGASSVPCQMRVPIAPSHGLGLCLRLDLGAGFELPRSLAAAGPGPRLRAGSYGICLGERWREEALCLVLGVSPCEPSSDG